MRIPKEVRVAEERPSMEEKEISSFSFQLFDFHRDGHSMPQRSQ